MKNLLPLIAFILIGCETQPDIRSASTADLEKRRTEINRKLKEDDMGVMWGVTRWVSHSSEKKSVIKEKQAIDAELMRRHRTSVGSTSERASQ
jgi:hypothetical protein